MVTAPKSEDDDLETATDKYFACDDFGKEGEFWYRCTGCEFGCMRGAAGGTSLMVACVRFALRCHSFLKLLYQYNSMPDCFVNEPLFFVAIEFFVVVL